MSTCERKLDGASCRGVGGGGGIWEPAAESPAPDEDGDAPVTGGALGDTLVGRTAQRMLITRAVAIVAVIALIVLVARYARARTRSNFYTLSAVEEPTRSYVPYTGTIPYGDWADGAPVRRAGPARWRGKVRPNADLGGFDERSVYGHLPWALIAEPR